MEKHSHLTPQAASSSVQSGQHTALTTDTSPLWSVLAGSLLVACIVALLLYLDAREQVVLLLNWVNAQGLWAPLLFIAIMAAVVLLLLPGIFFTMGAGFVFGVTKGTIYVVAGTTLGATTCLGPGGTRVPEDARRERVSARGDGDLPDNTAAPVCRTRCTTVRACRLCHPPGAQRSQGEYRTGPRDVFPCCSPHVMTKYCYSQCLRRKI